ncbi:MAG: URC4/urg3 family protein [Acidiferrobacterales bacterium]|nr:URC4/urg3 family protein [Acidiferrobacterales bacterium]
MSNQLTSLLSARAVREQCARIGEAAERGNTHWFQFHRTALSECIELVSAECLSNYPDLDIPYHSRWRHFVVNDSDLWQHYRDRYLSDLSPESMTRSAIDLIFISVLLDAGAGDEWKYLDPVSGGMLSRSEGLAAASLDLFFNELGETNPSGEFGISAQSLRRCGGEMLGTVFQHRSGNRLVGLSGRVALLSGLANTLEQPGDDTLTRPGSLYDLICEQFPQRRLQAGELLQLVLKLFNTMWPDGMVKHGVHLGDCGEHTLVACKGNQDGIVPFHKLSQWLTYSLLEPLQWSGIEITDLDQLTGLPEYRNGGLLLDTGVLSLKDETVRNSLLRVNSETVVEWRALTIWLLDEIAQGVRKTLGKSTQSLPLASVLQGGTWSCGRKLAAERRGGLPPLQLDIRGTVF